MKIPVTVTTVEISKPTNAFPEPNQFSRMLIDVEYMYAVTNVGNPNTTANAKMGPRNAKMILSVSDKFCKTANPRKIPGINKIIQSIAHVGSTMLVLLGYII